MESKLKTSFEMALQTTLSSNPGPSALKTNLNSTPTATKYPEEFPITKKSLLSSTIKTNSNTKNFSPTTCFPASRTWSKWKRKRSRSTWNLSCQSKLQKLRRRRNCFWREARSSIGWSALTMNWSCSLKHCSVLSVILISIYFRRITGTMRRWSFWVSAASLLEPSSNRLIGFLQFGSSKNSQIFPKLKSSKDNQKLFNRSDSSSYPTLPTDTYKF